MDEPIDEGEVEFARAVARGEPAAVARFEREILASIDKALATMRLDPAALDEVKQRVRVRLLVAEEGAPPRLVAYAGRGRLEGLACVTASRIALDLLRASKSNAAAPVDRLADDFGVDAARATGTGADPEDALVREDVKQRFRVAFAAAVDALDARERAVLKLHLLEGVTLDRLAGMYSVHRATVVRWLADARSKVLSRTRRELAESLGATDVDSTIALLESKLDASIERLFRTRS
ncbi:MAG: transcriptional regulator [Myxococcales bacterium]|nr:transcriptional regulator [Myxococcales bacterium]